MKIFIKFSLLIVWVSIISCNKYLDLAPLDSVPSTSYLWAENDLAAYTAARYSAFPVHSGYSLGVFAIDNNSDNQAGTTENNNFIPGQTRVPQSGGSWNFQTIRECNYFINTVMPRFKAGKLTGNIDNVKHYIGEMYFFRAYEYFNKLKAMGDFPIIKSIMKDDYNSLVQASKRQPRNVLARFILSDLDSAALMMKDVAPQSNRLNKKVAYLMKSRVALYEGTWLKYFKGSAFVPGGSGWPGANADYNKGFSINIDTESQFFLQQAMNAAAIVADATPLATDYAALFNSITLSVPEVLLYKKYDITITPTVNHFVVGYIQRDCGGNSGFTRSLVDSYLMSNGLPIYATGSGYKTDTTITSVLDSRDNRLVLSMAKPGDLLSTKPTFGTGFFRFPQITEMAENRCPTGYALKKGLTTDPTQGPTLPSITACVVFRAAEAYLNYIEAQYELQGSLDSKSRTYWQALRTRAKVSTDIDNTINATDLSKEYDFAKYSGGQLVDKTLYNIRRERRSEFIAEGMRLDDLYRWRALDKMQNWILDGFDLWDVNYKVYAANNIILIPRGGGSNPNISNKSDSKYLLPYRININNAAFAGYTFMKANYLEPIAFDNFRLSTPTKGGDITSSVIYQNPGWKTDVGSTATF